MANQEHLDLLKQGVDVWNKWRKENPGIRPDLSNANFSHVNLSEADLFRADLRRIDLSLADLSLADLNDSDLREANLMETDLQGATLIVANLFRANLRRANLRRATLSLAVLREAKMSEANLCEANLSQIDLRETDLSQADLSWTILSEANCSKANLTGCNIYAISAWNVKLEKTIQSNLIITRPDEPTITVDNLKIAQFIYLLLNNEEIRDVIDTITSKVVLILGRFKEERKKVLDALRDELRKHNYSPIVFDFEKPATRDVTETVSTLAHMARFVIADITDAKSIPQELMTIVPNLPSVPVQPLILTSQHEYGMFEHFTRFPWVLPVYRYTDEASLLQSLQESIIDPAEEKVKELERP